MEATFSWPYWRQATGLLSHPDRHFATQARPPIAVHAFLIRLLKNFSQTPQRGGACCKMRDVGAVFFWADGLAGGALARRDVEEAGSAGRHDDGAAAAI